MGEFETMVDAKVAVIAGFSSVNRIRGIRERAPFILLYQTYSRVPVPKPLRRVILHELGF
jgi:hypothetical protein